jgi:hypothetical protein
LLAGALRARELRADDEGFEAAGAEAVVFEG